MGYLIILAASVSFILGCDFTPEWNCLTANSPITLYETSDLKTESGQLEIGNHSEIVDKIKNEREVTTHFHIRTEDGTQGWFSWEGNDIAGGTRSNCW